MLLPACWAAGTGRAVMRLAATNFEGRFRRAYAPKRAGSELDLMQEQLRSGSPLMINTMVCRAGKISKESHNGRITAPCFRLRCESSTSACRGGEQPTLLRIVVTMHTCILDINTAERLDVQYRQRRAVILTSPAACDGAAGAGV